MSKGLKALKTLEKCKWHFSKEWLENYPIVEKELKALEIIKKKRVNIFVFYVCCGWHNPSNYNDSVGCPINCELTQEEYDLLKEVML